MGNPFKSLADAYGQKPAASLGEVYKQGARAGTPQLMGPFPSTDVAKLPRHQWPQGLVEPGNINLYNRPTVRNPDGPPSTVRSMSFNVDGHEVLVPSVSDDGRILTQQEALNNYLKTGQHLGKFSHWTHADKYAEALHNEYAAGKYGKQAPIQTTPWNLTRPK